MKKHLIITLLLFSSLVLSACGNSTSTSEEPTANNDQITSQTNDSDDSSVIDNDKKTDTKQESSDDAKKEPSPDSQKKDSPKVESKEPEKDNPSEDSNKQTNNTKPAESTHDSNDSISKYYGTWKISEVIGRTVINSNITTPLGKTLVLNKDSYKNNSTGLSITNPSYLHADLSAKAFAKGYNMENLNGTGLTGNTIHAIDITSSTNPNSDVDEIYVQDNYIVYLQDGVFFKCVKN